jgi:lysozyme
MSRTTAARLTAWIALPILVVQVGVVIPSGAQEEVLTTDPSRGQLFEIMAERAGLLEAYALKRAFAFPHDVDIDDSTGKKRTNSLFGIDVSHHNEENKDCYPHCKINWSALKQQGVYFAYAKASQGQGRDPRFSEHWTDLGQLPAANKIFRGAYHFLSSDGTGANQASTFLKTMGQIESLDLPPSLDLEWDVRVGPDGKVVKDASGRDRDFWDRVAPDQIIAQVVAWSDAVRSATHRTPLIYTNKAWWDERIKDEGKFAKLADSILWVAAYPKTVSLNEIPAVPNNSKWGLWQFTDRAVMTDGGLVGRVDANIFKGTTQDFQKMFGLGTN